MDTLITLIEYLRSGSSKVGYLNNSIEKNMLRKDQKKNVEEIGVEESALERSVDENSDDEQVVSGSGNIVLDLY